MAANKYTSLDPVKGTPILVSPTQVGGTALSGQIVALNNTGLLDATMMPAGIGATAVQAVANSAISAGQLVNLYNVSGTLTAKPADNSTPAFAVAYAVNAVAQGATGTFNLQSGTITGLSGLIPGTIYLLGTNGGFTVTAPTAVGSIIQQVGVATSATTLEFQPGYPTTIQS